MLFGLRTAIMATGKQITRYKTAIRISLSRPRSLELGFVTEAEFDPIVDPTKLVGPYVALPADGKLLEAVLRCFPDQMESDMTSFACSLDSEQVDLGQLQPAAPASNQE